MSPEITQTALQDTKQAIKVGEKIAPKAQQLEATIAKTVGEIENVERVTNPEEIPPELRKALEESKKAEMLEIQLQLMDQKIKILENQVLSELKKLKQIDHPQILAIKNQIEAAKKRKEILEKKRETLKERKY